MSQIASPFDRAAVLENLGGDEELLAQLAEVFVADWPESRSQLLGALEARDAAGLQAAAHAIKGAVSNFAAEKATTAAKAVELAGKAGDLGDAARLVAEAVDAVEEVVAALR